jgi:hypothetical protein
LKDGGGAKEEGDEPELRCSRRYSSRVLRKKSSHAARTRGVTLSRSSTAARMALCWALERMGRGEREDEEEDDSILLSY